MDTCNKKQYKTCILNPYTQDIDLIGFRDSCLLAQGYSMEGGYQTQYKTVGKSNTHFWGEVSRFTGIFGLHGEKN